MSLLIRKRPAALNVRRKGYQHTTKEKSIWYDHGSSAALFNEREYVRSKHMLLWLGEQLQYGDFCGASFIMKVHIQCYSKPVNGG